jgi:urease accessory protein
MPFTPIAQSVNRQGDCPAPVLQCELDYAARFIRRKRLTTRCGQPFLIDLPQTTSLNHGDTLDLSDGRMVQVVAADEALMRVTGPNLVRLAWHIGNRHTPCQIMPDHLLIQDDAVIGHMLEHLGASVTKVIAPFTPEGGAYGHGRTHAHEHGKTAHDH